MVKIRPGKNRFFPVFTWPFSVSLFNRTASSFHNIFLRNNKYNNGRNNHNYRNTQHRNNPCCVNSLKGRKPKSQCVLASVLQEKIPNMSVTVQATGGSIENCRLLASGDINIGHTTQMYDAYVGQGPFAEDGPNDKILALMDLYDVESVAIVLDKSSIQSLEDLEGKTVVLGPSGSGIASMATALMSAYGYNDSNCKMLNLANDQAVDALKDGTVDMIWGFCSAKVPASYLESLYTTVDCRALPQDPEKIKLACSESKDFFQSVIAGGTLPFVAEDYINMAAPAEQFASAAMSEDVAYTFVKTICENVDALANYYAPATCITAENALHGLPTQVPIHPGAAKYFKEAGVWDDAYTVGQ